MGKGKTQVWRGMAQEEKDTAKTSMVRLTLITYKGEVLPARELQCEVCKCQYYCHLKVDDIERWRLFNEFYKVRMQ